MCQRRLKIRGRSKLSTLGIIRNIQPCSVAHADLFGWFSAALKIETWSECTHGTCLPLRSTLALLSHLLRRQKSHWQAFIRWEMWWALYLIQSLLQMTKGYWISKWEKEWHKTEVETIHHGMKGAEEDSGVRLVVQGEHDRTARPPRSRLVDMHRLKTQSKMVNLKKM